MARRVEVAIVGDAKQLERAFGRATKAGGKFGKALKSGALIGGAALIGGGIAVAKFANQHDEAVKAIAAGTGASGEALEVLAQAYKQTFKSLPVDANTAATAIADLNTTTGATGKPLEDLVSGVLKASKAMKEDGAANAKAFGNAMNQWQIPVERGNEKLDNLFKIAQDTGIGFGELIGQLNTYGAVMANAGFNVDETAVLMGRMNKAGLDWSRISPGLNASFRKWAKDGKKPREELGRIIERVKNATSDTEALNIATAAFGAEGAQRMTRAIKTGAFAIDDLDESLVGAAGSINKTHAATLTLGDKFQVLKNRVVQALVPLGEKLLKALDSVANWVQLNWPQIRAILQTVFEAIKNAWETTLKPALEQARAGFEFVVQWVRDNWDEIRLEVDKVFNKVKEIVTGFIKIVQKIWAEFGDEILALLKSTWKQIKSTVKAAIKVIQGVIDVVMGLIRGDWNRAWTGIKKIVTGVLQGIKAVIRGTFERLFIIMKALGGRLIAGIVAGVKAIATKIKDSLLDPIVEEIVGFGTSAFNAAKDLAVSIKDGIVEGLKGIGQTIVDFIKTPINAVLDLIDLIKIPSFSVSIPGKSLPGPIPDIPGFSFWTPAIDPIPSIPRLAKGGTALAGGVAMVGEEGPELVTLGRGASVIPLQGGASGVTIQNLNVFGTGAAADDPGALAAAISWRLRTAV